MEKVQKTPKTGWMKTLGVIAGILMSILGILLFIKPIATTTVLVWLSFAGLFINAIVEIVKFFKAPKGQKDGLNLGLGILWIFISIIMFIYACGNPFAATVNIEAILAIMIGFGCIFSGIINICTCNKHKSMPLAIIGGILQIIVGILVLGQPMIGLFTLAVVFGLYLFVMGIVYIVNTLTNE